MKMNITIEVDDQSVIDFALKMANAFAAIEAALDGDADFQEEAE